MADNLPEERVVLDRPRLYTIDTQPLTGQQEQLCCHFCETVILNVALVIQDCHRLDETRQFHGITTLREILQLKKENNSRLIDVLKLVQIITLL